MANTDAPVLRALTPDDLPDLMALVKEAGWNQTPGDWKMMLALGNGRGLADPAGRIMASALTLPHGRNLGWIGMVLVAGKWRKRGYATRLLEDCITELREAGRVAGLDATPAGQPVYERLGFKGHQRISRWRRPAATPNSKLVARAQPIGKDDLARIAALDSDIFGAPRPGLIEDLCARTTPMGWVADESGFLLHRMGLKARQIGPLCASDRATAERLLDTALAQFDDELIIDACDVHTGFDELLQARNFVFERPFTRMYLGTPVPFGDPGRLFAIAGPELG